MAAGEPVAPLPNIREEAIQPRCHPSLRRNRKGVHKWLLREIRFESVCTMKEPSTGKGGIPPMESDTLGPYKSSPLARLSPRHSDETCEALKQDIALHRLTAGPLLAGGAGRRCSGDSGRNNGCSWQPLHPPQPQPCRIPEVSQVAAFAAHSGGHGVPAGWPGSHWSVGLTSRRARAGKDSRSQFVPGGDWARGR